MSSIEPAAQQGELLSPADDERLVFADRARRLGLPFVAEFELGAGVVDIEAIKQGAIAASSVGERLAYIAPNELAMAEVSQRLAAIPAAARRRICVSTPTAIRSALTRLAAADLVADVTHRLERVHPHFSARHVVTFRQAVAALFLAALVTLAAIVSPFALLVGLNIVGAIFFFGVSALRFVASAATAMREPVKPNPTPLRRSPLPVYTILVPLRGEAAMVADLVAGLDKLDWPRDRLDIKLILEESDPATVAAARRVVSGAPYEILVVPNRGPCTKPKALSFALPLARGEFVTVYDAEDRPNPAQLRAAYAAFARAGPEVACVQASLAIDNGAASWLSLLFSIEYAALFDGLLPALASLGMPLPLGGTSNHFRRSALEAVGGWDPYNVTEDADLGLRLARFGYRATTIDVATFEEAPENFAPWLRQRARWFKGWMQTLLVHTRSPVRLARELGVRGLLGFMLMGPGMIVSSLVYPIYLATLGLIITNPKLLWGDGGVVAAAVLGINLFNLVAGHLAMMVLSQRALRLRGRQVSYGVWGLPLYWILMSLASYRALVELAVRPHHWAKTPHRRRGAVEQLHQRPLRATTSINSATLRR